MHDNGLAYIAWGLYKMIQMKFTFTSCNIEVMDTLMNQSL